MRVPAGARARARRFAVGQDELLGQPGYCRLSCLGPCVRATIGAPFTSRGSWVQGCRARAQRRRRHLIQLRRGLAASSAHLLEGLAEQLEMHERWVTASPLCARLRGAA